MQAVCKIVRQRAVCGAKPGGASAYDLRESCIKKDKPRAGTKKKPEDARVLRMKELLSFSFKELRALKVRQAYLKKLQSRPEPLPKPGYDHHLVKKFLFQARENQHMSIRLRIKKVCDEFNEKRGARAQVYFNRSLEKLVILGAYNHYIIACSTMEKQLG